MGISERYQAWPQILFRQIAPSCFSQPEIRHPWLEDDIPMSDIADRAFSARLDCHYLLSAPASVDASTVLAVALHGFGASPEAMLPLSARLFDRPPVIVSLQGPNQFFLGPDNRGVGYGWNTSRRPAESIRLHHEMVLHAAEEAGREFGVSPERRLLIGFSQPVSLNYRFAATHPDAFRGVIGICGGLPGDWDEGAYRPLRAAVLHIARRQDEYYTPAVTAQYAERLRRRAADVEFHLLEGGHQMPSEGHRVVAPWLRRILS
jgi:phospholipase/carboxylesterase